MQSELDIEKKKDMGRIFGWRLGLLVLNGYLGAPIFSQEILKVQLPLRKCCLFHEILESPHSLAALYF